MSVLVPAKSPSLSAVFMAAAAAMLLLLVARALFLFMRLWSGPAKEASFPVISRHWARSLQWNTLPASLPFALTLPEKPFFRAGNGVDAGLSQKRPQVLPIVIWQPRTGPQFQPPPPALYESPVPLSMAKMIMSRHTFRRPNPNRPRKPSTTSSRPTSPPQTPSRLYHSIA